MCSNYNYPFPVFLKIFEAASTIFCWKNAENTLFLPKKRFFSKFFLQKNLPLGDWYSPSIKGHFRTTPSSGHSKLSLSMYRNAVPPLPFPSPSPNPLIKFLPAWGRGKKCTGIYTAEYLGWITTDDLRELREIWVPLTVSWKISTARITHVGIEVTDR